MNLKEIRNKTKLTQNDLALKLNIARSTYNGYEQGISEPNIETLCKLADYYDVSLDYLVGRQYKNDIGFLSPEQKNIVYVIKQLNEKNLAFILGQSLKLLNEQ